jgi:site-specific DNA-cytosine methylase
MAAQELGVRVVGGSEVDPQRAAASTKRTGAKSDPPRAEPTEGGKRGEYPELHGLDIVTSGVPCPYRSNAGSLTSSKGKEQRKASSERHLFEKQVEFFKIYRSRAAMIEQPPPSATHLAEYMNVLKGMQECGY